MRMGLCCTICFSDATVGSDRRGLRNPFRLMERKLFMAEAGGEWMEDYRPLTQYVVFEPLFT